MKKYPHGVIDQSALNRKNDYLYRVSLKGLVRNKKGEVLVVKEAGRTWWDLPGGGMDHNENVHSALAREMHEEVKLSGDFSYRPIFVDEPGFLEHANVWQLRIVFEIIPENFDFSTGEDAYELSFINPDEFKESANSTEQNIYRYVKSLTKLNE